MLTILKQVGSWKVLEKGGVWNWKLSLDFSRYSSLQLEVSYKSEVGRVEKVICPDESMFSQKHENKG